MERLIFLVLVASSGAFPSDWRIIGGQEASKGQFPYQISLRIDNSHNCGGSIIDQRWIMTAAHCIAGYSTESLSVVAGSNSLKEGGITYQVEKVIYHEEYNFLELKNDIGLVKVDKDMEFNKLIQPIELDIEYVDPGVELTLSGWGRYDNNLPNIPDKLQFAKLKSISYEECKKRHDYPEVQKTQICTYTRYGQGACHGDSGGPLTHNNKVAGIVSWGRPCAIGYPDVFTRVSEFIDWIHENAI